MKSVLGRVALSVALLAPVAAPAPLAELRAGFRNPPDDCRLMVRWWWFGPAVTPRDLEREMRAMKQAGIGGFEIQPVYPLTVNDTAHGLVNLPYLSEDFLKAVRYTAGMARRLGLRMDMTLGSGWPFGGPHIPPELAAGWLRVESVPVGEAVDRVPLPRLKPGEKLTGAWYCFDGVRSELTDIAGDFVRIRPGLAPPRTMQFYIAGRTGMQVKRAAEAAPEYPENGLNLVEAYLKWGERTGASRELQTLEAAWPAARTNFVGEAWAASWADWEPRLKKLKKKIEEPTKSLGTPREKP